MPLQDKLSIIASAFLKIAINFWPFTLFIVCTVVIGAIKEYRESEGFSPKKKR